MRTARTLMSNVEAVEATKQLRNTRPGGHRIEHAPLIEYQMSQSNMMLRPLPRYAAVEWLSSARPRRLDGLKHTVCLSSTIRISLAMISQVR